MHTIEAIKAVATAYNIDHNTFASKYKLKDKYSIVLHGHCLNENIPYIIKPAGGYNGEAVACEFVGGGRAICKLIDKSGKVVNRFEMPAEAI